jgi:hypothetical protein
MAQKVVEVVEHGICYLQTDSPNLYSKLKFFYPLPYELP